ncbi:diguanylate cyclase domain-containing protein [Variovorax sp. MHTC-1]|uniref:diguanylate cyclase domain-containing protein n=1 Tax=Variovorax sp. MHTC-1 TaxID=2495593 RepID=UPI000F88D23E|nr:diguanylate cyclase [Variovorax sp. MHTC-1]RST49391.1 diguanylate cyclase [Variovorax sp. MHTC-1]
MQGRATPGRAIGWISKLRFGHNAGDQLLRAFTDWLSQALRPSGISAHLGGDEFTVITEALAQRRGDSQQRHKDRRGHARAVGHQTMNDQHHEHRFDVLSGRCDDQPAVSR